MYLNTILQNFGFLVQQKKAGLQNGERFFTALVQQKNNFELNYILESTRLCFFQFQLSQNLVALFDNYLSSNTLKSSSLVSGWFQNNNVKYTWNQYVADFMLMPEVGKSNSQMIMEQKTMIMQKAENAYQTQVSDYIKATQMNDMSQLPRRNITTSLNDDFKNLVRQIISFLPQSSTNQLLHRDPLAAVLRLSAALTIQFGLYHSRFTLKASLDEAGTTPTSIVVEVKMKLIQYSQLIQLIGLNTMRCLNTRDNKSLEEVGANLQKLNNLTQQICKVTYVQWDAAIGRKTVRCLHAMKVLSNMTKTQPIPRGIIVTKAKGDAIKTVELQRKMETMNAQLCGMSKMTQNQATVLVNVRPQIKLSQIVIIDNNPNGIVEQGQIAISAEPKILAIQAEKKLYPNVNTNEIVVVTTPQQTPIAKKSNNLRNGLQLATLLLVQRRLSILEQINKKIVICAKQLQQGLIFDAIENYSILETNATLSISIANNMLIEVQLCQMTLKKTQQNKIRVKHIKQRLRLVSSPALKTMLTSSLLQFHSKSALWNNDVLKKQLSESDRIELRQDTAELLQLFLKTEGKVSDTRKQQIVREFMATQNPIDQILIQFSQQIEQHGSILSRITDAIKKKRQLFKNNMENQDNNMHYQQQFKVRQTQELVKQIGQLKQNLTRQKKKLDIVRTVSQTVIMQQAPPAPTDDQAASAIKLIGEAHKNLIGKQTSDYFLSASQGIGISNVQMNQVQYNTYINNFNNVNNYIGNQCGFVGDVFLGPGAVQLYNISVNTNYLINQQITRTNQQANEIKSMLYGISYQNQVIYNQVAANRILTENLTAKAKRIDDLLSLQKAQLESMQLELHKLGQTSLTGTLLEQRLKLINENSSGIKELLLKQENLQIAFNALLQRINTFASKNVQITQQIHQAILQSADVGTSTKSAVLAGNLQLAKLLGINSDQLQQMTLTNQNINLLANTVMRKSGDIQSRLNELITSVQQEKGQNKMVSMKIIQGLAGNLRLIEELYVMQNQNNLGQGQIAKNVQQLSSFIEDTFNALHNSSSQNVKKIINCIDIAMDTNKKQMNQYFRGVQYFMGSLWTGIQNGLGSNNKEINALRQEIQIYYQNQFSAIQQLRGQMQFGFDNLYLQGQGNTSMLYDIGGALQDIMNQNDQREQNWNWTMQAMKQDIQKINQTLVKKDELIELKNTESNLLRKQLISLIQRVQKISAASLSDQQLVKRVKKVFEKLNEKQSSENILKNQLSRIYGVMQITQDMNDQQKLDIISTSAIKLKGSVKQLKEQMIKKQCNIEFNTIQKGRNEAQIVSLKKQRQQNAQKSQKLTSQIIHLSGEQQKAKLLKEQLLDQKQQMRYNNEQNRRNMDKIEANFSKQIARTQQQASLRVQDQKQIRNEIKEVLNSQLDKTQTTMNKMQEKIEKYEKMFSQTIPKKQFQTYKNETNARHKREIQEAKGNAKQMEESLEEMRAQMLQQRQDKASLEATMAGLRSERDRLVNESKDKVTNKPNIEVINDLRNQLKIINQKQAFTKKMIAQKQDMQQMLKQKQQQLENDKKLMEKQKLENEIEQQRKKSRMQLEALKRTNQNITESKQRQVRKLNQQIQSLTQNEAQLTSAKNALQAKIKAMDQKMTKDATNNRKAITDLTFAAQKLRTQHLFKLEQMEQSMQKKTQELRILKEQSEKTQREYKEAKKQFDKEKSLLSSLNAQKLASGRTIKQLTEKVDKKAEEVKQLKQAMEKAQDGFQKVQKQIRKQLNLANEKVAQIAGLQQEIKNLKETLSKTNQKVKQLEQDVIPKKSKQIDRLAKIQTDLRQQNLQNKKEAMSQSQKLKAVNQELTNLKSTINNLQADKNRLISEKKISENKLQLEIQRLNDEADVLDKELAEAGELLLQDGEKERKLQRLQKVLRFKLKVKQLRQKKKKIQQAKQDVDKLNEKLNKDITRASKLQESLRKQVQTLTTQKDLRQKSINELSDTIKAKQLLIKQQDQINLQNNKSIAELKKKIGQMEKIVTKLQEIEKKNNIVLAQYQRKQKQDEKQRIKRNQQLKSLKEQLEQKKQMQQQFQQVSLKKKEMQAQIQKLKGQIKKLEDAAAPGSVSALRQAEKLNKENLEKIKALNLVSKTKDQIIRQCHALIEGLSAGIKSRKQQLQLLLGSQSYDGMKLQFVQAYINEIRVAAQTVANLQRMIQLQQSQVPVLAGGKKGDLGNESTIIQEQSSGIHDLWEGEDHKNFFESVNMQNIPNIPVSSQPKKNQNTNAVFIQSDLGKITDVKRFIELILQSIQNTAELLHGVLAVVQKYIQELVDLDKSLQPGKLYDYKKTLIGMISAVLDEIQTVVYRIFQTLTTPFEKWATNLPNLKNDQIKLRLDQLTKQRNWAISALTSKNK